MCIRDRPVGFFQIEKQILHVRIVQGGAFSVETDGLYDVLAVGQDVVCDSPGKQAVCGLLWSNWCEYKRKLGVDFGESVSYTHLRYRDD